MAASAFCRFLAARCRQSFVGHSQCYNGFNNKQFLRRTTHVMRLESNQSIVLKHGFLWAGVLTWLGLRKEEEDPIVAAMKQCILCVQKNNYDKAETILHSALELAQKRHDFQEQRHIYDLLANVALQKGDFLKAEKLFLQVTKELIATGAAMDDDIIVENSLRLASIYSQMDNVTKAEEGFMFCITALEKKLKTLDMNNVESLSDADKDTVLLWIMCLDQYAQHLLSRKALKAAEENFQKAFDISKKVGGPAHPQTLALMYNLGSVARLQSNYDKGVEWFEQSLAVVAANQTEQILISYCNLCETYLLKGDGKKAFESCSDSLKLARKLQNKPAETYALRCLERAKHQG